MAIEPDERIGSLVDGRYKIVEAMAAGSMGVVYKAERVPVGKLVAIKFLHTSFANDTEFQTRFERETQVMSKLAHPNCVSVVDFGVWEESPYIVMEFVAGKTLRSIIDIGPLPPLRALGLVRQIAAGLAHAHAQGIVHRDIKPANIMITEEIGTGEHVRILDFGLARLRGQVGRDATQMNVVVGTPNYMAPEQTVGGGIIDARTDIYAVGVVLFEMVVGDRPFQAEDTLALLGMHRAAPIPKLADRVPDNVDLPDGLQAVIEKAMAKSPGDRYPSAIELATAIDQIIGVRTTGPQPLVGTKSKPNTKAALAPTMPFIDSSSDAGLSVSTTTPSLRTARRGFKAKRSSFPALLVLLVLGGGAYAAWRATHKKPSAGSGSQVAKGSGSDGSGKAVKPPPPRDPWVTVGSASGAGEVLPPVDAAEPPPADAAEAAAIDAAEPTQQTGSNGEIEMAPDPAKAENIDPASPAANATDEDPDAPATTADVEKREPAPAPPALAKTVPEALAMIKDGKRGLALASLRALQKSNPRSAYIPFLLGNLYFDQRWWGVALEYYGTAIDKNAGYKYNATLIRNCIRMLASKRTAGKAEYFLMRTVGRPARPYLLQAARYDGNARVKGYAAYIARRIR